MEQLVIEQRVAPPKAAPASLWRALSPGIHNTKRDLNTPPASTFIIINNVVYGANILEPHAQLIPQGVAISKDGLSTSTLADLQCCLQRRANDTFPVRLWGASVLESPCMFIESQTPEWLVLKHAWWHH